MFRLSPVILSRVLIEQFMNMLKAVHESKLWRQSHSNPSLCVPSCHLQRAESTWSTSWSSTRREATAAGSVTDASHWRPRTMLTWSSTESSCLTLQCRSKTTGSSTETYSLLFLSVVVFMFVEPRPIEAEIMDKHEECQLRSVVYWLGKILQTLFEVCLWGESMWKLSSLFYPLKYILIAKEDMEMKRHRCGKEWILMQLQQSIRDMLH